MKITRTINNQQVEIELTKDELEAAFREQEYKYYLEEIRFAIECYNSNTEEQVDEQIILNNADLCSAVIHDYKKVLYNDDGERWQDVVSKIIT